MTAIEWITKNNVDLHNYHGNIGDSNGICIEQNDGTWIFWGDSGIENIPKKYYE